MPGCSSCLPARRRQAEGDRVFGRRGVRAGVDVDVVLGQPRHAGDDSLHLLVGGVGGDEGVLGVGEDLLDFVAVLVEQSFVVEVDRLGQLVVLVGVLLQRFDLLDQFGRVVGEVALDRLQLGRARLGRRFVAVAIAATAATGAASASAASAKPNFALDFIESIASLNRGSLLGLPKSE